MDHYSKTERTRLRRLPKRACYDVAVVNAIIDEAMICHLATTLDGQTLQQPTIHWRHGNQLYVHGSSKNGLFKALLAGSEACIGISLVDGIVFARSAFHHSLNFRSVVIYSHARLVEDADEKAHALDLLLEKFRPGRSREARAANEIELKATSVLAFELDELSAKIRTGGPVDDPEDRALPIWAGVQPVSTLMGAIEYDDGETTPSS